MLFSIIKKIPFILACLTAATLQAEPLSSWPATLELNPKNTRVYYLVETSLLDFQGQAQELSGSLHRQESGKDPVLSGKIRFSVTGLESGNDSRDTAMFNHMQSERFPDITFKLKSTRSLCPPEEVARGRICEFEAIGNLTVRDTDKLIALDCQARYIDEHYEISGRGRFKWTDFGISDPSFFIAQVYEDMTVMFRIEL